MVSQGKGLQLTHDKSSDEPSSSAGDSQRDLPQRHRGYDATPEDAQRDQGPRSHSGGLERGRPVHPHVHDDGGQGDQGELFSVERVREFQFREAPFPPASELAEYAEVDPGYPDKIMDMSAHTLRTNLRDQSRSVWAESFSTVTGALAAPIVTLGSLAATVWLGLGGHMIPAIGTSIPFMGITVSQIVVTIGRSRRDDENEE